MAVKKIYTMTLAEAEAEAKRLRDARDEKQAYIDEATGFEGGGVTATGAIQAAKAVAASLEPGAPDADIHEYTWEDLERLEDAEKAYDSFQESLDEIKKEAATAHPDPFLSVAWETYVADQIAIAELEEYEYEAGGTAAADAQRQAEIRAAEEAYRAEMGYSPEQYADMYQKRVEEIIAENPDLHMTDEKGNELDRRSAAEYTANQELLKKHEDFGEPRPEYKEQCFLLANIFELVEYKKTKPKALAWGILGAPQTNVSTIVDGDPYKFMNLLTQYPSHKDLYNLKTEEISQLQPMIRLYKITELENAPFETFQEIRFDSYLTPDDVSKVLTKSTVRGVGVGIKDFTFSYEADNPFAIKKSIKAKLTLFANSFDELLKDRSKSPEAQWTYADLALKTGSPLTRKYANPQNLGGAMVYDLDKLNFRLKAVVGWASPGANTTFKDNTTVRDAIYNSYISLNLTPTVHEFDIDDLGRVTFTINYLAYVEDFFDQSGFNIFADEETSRRVLERKLEYETLVADCAKAAILSEKKKAWKDQIDADKKTGLKALLAAMQGDPEDHENTSKIYLLEIDYDKITDFMSEGPYYVDKGISDSIHTELSDSVTASIMGSVDAAHDAAAAGGTAANDPIPADQQVSETDVNFSDDGSNTSEEDDPFADENVSLPQDQN